MKSLPKKWQNTPYDNLEVTELQQVLNIHPVLCQLLVQRGVKTYQGAKDFFRPQWEHLHDPFLMLGMEQAVQRIVQAIIKGEKIILYGDYDVDGTTAVAIVYRFLSKYHNSIDYYIPDRYQEGYGLSIKGIEWAKEQEAALMIVLDCGIKGLEAVARANELGIDTIICDHHLPDEKLPHAYAILNPKQPNCPYPYKELSGCAIGFKLLQGFVRYCAIEESGLKTILDLVAVSLACDFVALTGENRVLMHFGLHQLNTAPSTGIATLKKMLQRNKNYTVRDIVFGIGPHINAAGRLVHAGMAVELLIADEAAAAQLLAQQLIDINIERRAVEQQVEAEAFAQLEAEKVDWSEQHTIVVYQADWHQGVVGIVAARLVDKYHKPSIVLTLSGDEIVGSARTAGNFDIHAALQQCQDLLIAFGGHKHAAGLSLNPTKLGAFISRLEEVAAKMLVDTPNHPVQHIDATIDLETITTGFWNILQQFEPFGPQNMRPVFATQSLRDTGYATTIKERHLKLKVKQKQSKPLKGIGFNLGHYLPLVQGSKSFDICYVLEENTYKNKTSLQLNIRDVKETIV